MDETRERLARVIWNLLSKYPGVVPSATTGYAIADAILAELPKLGMIVVGRDCVNNMRRGLAMESEYLRVIGADKRADDIDAIRCQLDAAREG